MYGPIFKEHNQKFTQNPQSNLQLHGKKMIHYTVKNEREFNGKRM